MDKTTVTVNLEQKDESNPPRPPQNDQKLPGILRMEAAASKLTTTKRWIFFTSIFFFSYALNLDFLTRNTYVPYATSSFGNHSLLATVNVIREVVAAAIQPSVARLTDVFGRIEIFTLAVLFSLTGTIIQTYSGNIQTFAGGAVLHSLGYRISMLTIELMIADFTSMKTRLFFAFVPNWPGIVNTWVSGDVTSAILSATSWKWGVGMFAIINPICALPLIVLMFLLGRQTKSSSQGQDKPNTDSWVHSLKKFFWELDVIGVLLLTAALAMTLIPLTLAGGQRRYPSGIALSIRAIVVGSLLGPIVIKLRRLKELILTGIVLWFVGFGLIYNYRGGSGSKSGVIGGEVVVGIGAGLLS
ncbi:hypothetical protein IL306_000900 [Fusarium sp. DS 682]|nr:hypothetical protein IL306_000900 [Fusarium sp. DS 682]